MSGTKDPAIKLFGKTIPLPTNVEIPIISINSGAAAAAAAVYEVNNKINHYCPSSKTSKSDKTNRVAEEQEQHKGPSGGKPSETKDENCAPPLILEELIDPASGINENSQTPCVDKENAAPKTSNTENQMEASNSEEKTLKKPDKILPCPRCNSMDTKFCYYNNYNVSQPRHFCKSCQRYWTDGGLMRNVPVGAGRRKNKNSTSHYRQITVSEAPQTARTDAPNGIHHSVLKTNGTVLTFGSDAPLCESMASVLNLTEKTTQNCIRNGFHRPEEQRIPVSCGGGEHGDDHSSGSSVTVSNSTEDGSRAGLQPQGIPNCHGFPPQIPCYPGAPWPYPAQWGSAIPPPTFFPSNFPISFYPATTYWGCTVPGTWSIPWMSPPASSPNPEAPGSILNSSALGKHSRDGNILRTSNSEKGDPLKESDSERCLWIPKTSRIDDPSEATRSSIWATLGIKNEKAGSISGGSLLKAYQSKGDEKKHMPENSWMLQANPAALSRSLNFHESS